MSYNTINVTYSVSGGKCEGSDEIDWGEVELPAELVPEWTRALMVGETIDDHPAIQRFLNSFEDTILDQERENFRELMMDDGEETDEDEDPMDGYTVYVSTNDSIEPEEDEVLDYLRECFADNDACTASEVVAYQGEAFDDLAEEAFRLALNVGCADYVRGAIEYWFDFNEDEDALNYWLRETTDDTCKKILKDAFAGNNE